MTKIQDSKVMVSQEVNDLYEKLMSHAKVKAGLDFIKSDNERTVAEQVELTSIPAPTFDEEEKGAVYKQKLMNLGLTLVTTDEVGNVFGMRPGAGNGPTLVVCAHLDTVFPSGTDVAPQYKNGKIYAPGIADDGRGLAAVLGVLRGLNEAGIETEGDIWFGATVGEEGLGDLRGVKALFEDRDDIDGFISIEPGAPVDTTYLATGSRRYRVTYKGTGGHSFGNFGNPSAIHAMGRAIAAIAEIQTPTQPKTTFNVGVIDGGTSVNTIAEEASMLVDMRSTSPDELFKLEKTILKLINKAAEDENKRWESEDIKVTLDLVGDRPAGSQAADSIIVQTALASSLTLGYEPVLDAPSSTDSNVPISLGIPAVTLGGGGDFGGTHTLAEYFDPEGAYDGIQRVFLTVLGLVGIQDTTQPLLEKR